MYARTAIVVSALAAAITASAQARPDTLALWTFETTGPNIILNNSATSPVAAADSGIFGGNAQGVHTSANTDWTSPAGNGSAECFSANEWQIGDYWEFTTSTLGYQNITIGWDQTRSATGATTFDLYYSNDGVNFTNLVDDYAVLENVVANGGTWNTTTSFPAYTFAPLGTSSDMNNQSTVWFRFVAQNAGTNTGGTGRIDNVIIQGDAVPAPGALALLALAGVTARARRRR